MACPSLKDIQEAAAGASRRGDAVREHLRGCPACQARAEEEVRLDTLFRRAFDPPEPSPFLWTRIEARLTEPAPRRSVALWHLVPARVMAGALTLVVVAASAVALFQGPGLFGPSRDAILAYIDREYQRTQLELQAAEENPFDGRGLLESARDENPFQVASQPESVGPAGEENPFRAVLKEYKD